MTTFGDADLFDAWDDGDNILVKLALIIAIAHWLQANPDPVRKAEAMRLLLKLRALFHVYNDDLEHAATLIETS